MAETEPTAVSESKQTLGPVAIAVDGAHVRYKVYEEPKLTARGLFNRAMRGRRSTEVHAVRGVSVEVNVGEAVGIVGSNGSGKSTLLRAIAGLQTLSAGSIQVRGEVGLLGVGAALKPTLSGYRNVMLGGLALGLSKDEVNERLDEVAEFSGLGSAMGRPMNTYSSGMRARLAFSIATLRVPDILLIDEALAVGDKDFRERSLARLDEIREAAGTIVMVTHNLSEIRKTCSRSIWFDQGEIRMDGETEAVLSEYSDER
ncbi:teichoic acid transport system ATP-binding protein [Ilumatobacter fluminis]|uniref:Teichoic acid transport system ATP-binding protein n=1 Tax=Ilumatobacter fluminis TaxID=467091 RepID=A0A4R7I180_9ACTN|nr:ABC transporter ATP-binding protein [Ilumatobacter fluminis]TDT17312.1 teichoic acid transport system ATP-binding protein [Ilumatobacter fluminis]